MPEGGVSRRGGRVHGPAGFLFGRVCGVSAGQAGVLAMVMTAGAMRVTVSFAVGVREGGRGLGLAGAVPVTVDDVPVSPDLAGHGLVAGVPEADRGQDRPEGAGEGQVTGPDREPGPAAFPCGGRGERGVASDAAGHLDGRGPGGESCRTRSGEPERSIGPVPGRRRAAAPWPRAARS